MNGSKKTMRWLRRALLAAAATVAAPAVHAAPCVGFTDLDDSSSFCQFVEWIKNRSITQGCTATEYCPNNSVTRLQMAAFMKRLGDALTPVLVAADLSPGAIDLDASPVVCQASYTVASFPRTAYADATVSATAASDVSFAADLVISTDGGANWTPLNANPNRGAAPAGQWGAVADVGTRTLDVGQNVLFGTRVSRGGVASGVDLGDSRCQLRVLVYSRTGTASPR